MQFSAWTLFNDLGLAAALILVGQLLRTKVIGVQKLFLPASLVAGLVGLALGPNGAGIIPFSGTIGVYPGILIALIFASLPMASDKVNFQAISGRVGSLWSYSQSIILLQYGLGAVFGIFFLQSFWPDLNDGFGLILAIGFVGGHGSAAAMGAAYESLGWADAASLGMTSATVGIVSAILGGLILIKLGARKGHTRYITDFKDLPNELRRGIMPEGKRVSLGQETTSPISVDPLMFHLALILACALGGYWLSVGWKMLVPTIALPVFCCAFIAGFVIWKILCACQVNEYVDQHIINRLSGTSTDLLVVFGVSSIKLTVVAQYALPLALLFLFGLGLCFFCFYFLGPRMLRDHWFEKSIFTWGWVTGAVSTGIALLRIVDPKLESKTLDDFALAYLPIAPVEIFLVSFSPIIFSSGNAGLYMAGTVGAGAGIILFRYLKGWRVAYGPEPDMSGVHPTSEEEPTKLI